MNFRMDDTDHLADWVREQPVPDGRDLEICARALGTERFPREHDGFLRRRLAMLLDRTWAYDIGKGSAKPSGDMPTPILNLALTNHVVAAAVGSHRNRTMTAQQALEAMVLELARQNAEYQRLLTHVEATRPIVVTLNTKEPA